MASMTDGLSLKAIRLVFEKGRWRWNPCCRRSSNATVRRNQAPARVEVFRRHAHESALRVPGFLRAVERRRPRHPHPHRRQIRIRQAAVVARCFRLFGIIASTLHSSRDKGGGRRTGSWQKTRYRSSEQRLNLVKLLSPTNLRQRAHDEWNANLC